MIQQFSESYSRKPLVDVSLFFKSPLQRKIYSIVRGPFERVMAVDALNRMYRSLDFEPGQDFFERALKVMNIQTLVEQADLDRIPKTGPLVVVANHPFGGIEGIVLGAILRTARPDVKLMANYLLKAVPEIQDSMIYVDPFDRDESASINVKPLKQSVRWLRGGGVLGVFPAGAVSHLHLRRGGVSDPEWSHTIGRIIRMTGAAVVPVFFQGANSMLFQILGMLHPRLRTGMLPRELVNKCYQKLELRIGHPISPSRLEKMADDRDVMEYLRLRTYHLGRRGSKPARKPFLPLLRKPAQMEEIAPPVAADILSGEVARLPAGQRLISNGPFSVYYAEASQIPQLLLEIGRLREVTFRGAKEGSGRARDLDRFDESYLHLFVWNGEKSELVGAYRLGQSDRIVRVRGLKGLYTSTLFRYRRKLLNRLGPALEMGRSFVRPEYQKNFSSLLLLWKGIALFVSKHPRYRYLFGPVSISNDYQSVSRILMVSFLKSNCFLPDLARLVRPKKALRTDPITHMKLGKQRAAVSSLEEVESLIADLESELKGLPVLLRQYLRLGGKLLAFNVDPDFSNVLDGLILVDLTETQPNLLGKYMGVDAANTFRAFHGKA